MPTLPPLPTIQSGSDSGTSADYGLASDAATQKFDVTGLGIPGLTGMVDGKTLLQYFIASGSGRLGDGGQTAAAIQHAMLFGQMYTDSGYHPTFGQVKDKDAQAFAQALNLLGKSNATQPNSVPGMDTPTESVANYLTRNAALGAANGSVGVPANLREVQNVRTPDTTTLMAVADKAFQAIQGKHATIAQQRAFAQSFQQMYTETETANNDSLYQARINSALGDAQPAQPATSLAQQQQITDPVTQLRDQLRHVPGMPRNAELGLGAADTLPPDLGPTMDSLQQAAGGGQAPLTGETNVTTQALPTAAGASAYAENFARNANPNGAAANDTASVFDLFQQILSSHFGG